MLRSNAPGLYGWDILLRGTCWPGPIIGAGLSDVLRDAARAGHEIGVHAWDHHEWQARIEKADEAALVEWTQRACELLEKATGTKPVAVAAPGWRATPEVLLSREKFPFRFNSDCRGETIFCPIVGEAVLSQPQIPNTLPTYDEVIRQNGISDANYNEFMLSQLRPNELNVLTIHAEVEGIARAELFEKFLDEAAARDYSFVPMGALLHATDDLPQAEITPQFIKGREGWVAVQK